MPYAFTQDVPIDRAFYDRVRAGLGDELPDGLLVHLVVARPEGGLRYYDVWASEAQCERFTDERLHPVVHGLLSEVFGDDLPAEPQRVELAVIDLWGHKIRAPFGP